MSIEYSVDESRNVVLVTVRGTVNDHEFLDYVRQFHNDNRIRPGYRELVDATAASPGVIRAELFDQIAELDRQRPEMLPRAKTAIVVSSGEAFELARQYESKAQMPVTVFSSLDVARIWLGIN
ncbi:MAG TPA: hypothetical protein DIC36_04830 [Gammaproteobacteria bacterium]|jgi:hypothetical protein|nr:hypothetical protein [Gammaproteobacteria bacterium]